MRDNNTLSFSDPKMIKKFEKDAVGCGVLNETLN
jgi:hypothetical protein